ncbi:hypothetical protein F5882DRAFT_387509 [Hyaloscypha sp. PMI_1271]|nr:hypothetical protein F5882DRAFT_387509 [Hyaloscypha sp. PMI_1271]
MRAKIKRKWKKWQVGPNRLTAGSLVSNRLLTISNWLLTSRSIWLSYKFKVQITNYVIFKSLGHILTSYELVVFDKNTYYKTYLDKAKSKSITLSKYKGKLISNLEKHKLIARNKSLTSRRRSPKINNNNSGDELLTSRNSYTFYNELKTSLELYNPTHLFNTNEENYNKKDFNSPNNLIILNND